jgi:hypothetical protein
MILQPSRVGHPDRALFNDMGSSLSGLGCGQLADFLRYDQEFPAILKRFVKVPESCSIRAATIMAVASCGRTHQRL